MIKENPIGVIDSGVGGLSVLRNLQKALPHEDFIYLGDTANTPYGTRTRENIISLVNNMTNWLEKKHIKQLVVACNTITVLGTDVIKGKHTFHVIGMSKGAELALAATKNKRIGVFATDFTVSTGAHKKAILTIDSDAQVFAQGCTKFVPLIEKEKFNTPELDEAINEYANILKAKNVDTVLLSCTHYPFVKAEVQKAFGPGVTVLDPAEATVIKAIENLKKNNLMRCSGDGKCEVCFTADINRAKRLSARMLDVTKCSFSQFDICIGRE